MKSVWMAAFVGLVLFGSNLPANAQYGGAYPQPLTQAAYCPTCAQQGGMDASAGVDYQPSQPWSEPHSASLPEMHSSYHNPRDQYTGWYIGGFAGTVYLEDQLSEAINPNLRRVDDAKFDWGPTGGMAIGYRLPIHPRDLGQLRLEFDTAYRENNVKTLLFNGVQRTATGEVTSNAFMFNIAMDFVNWGGALTPYIGGGVGVVRVNEHIEYGQARFIDDDIVFGFQGFAGASLKLWDNVDLFTEFRYLGASNPKLLRIGPTAPSNVMLRSEYNSYAIMSGVRINLP